MELLKRIDMALEKSGKTRADLARELGISTQAINSMAKRPNAKMRHENLVKAAQALSCTVEWLASGKGPKPKVRSLVLHGDPAQAAFTREDAELEMQASMVAAMFMRLPSDAHRNTIIATMGAMLATLDKAKA